MVNTVKRNFLAKQPGKLSPDQQWLSSLIVHKIAKVDSTIDAVDFELALELKQRFPAPKGWTWLVQTPLTPSPSLPEWRDWKTTLETKTRKPRSINVNIDAASAISALFQGASDLFHAPTLKRVRHEVSTLAKSISTVATHEQTLLNMFSNLTDFAHNQALSYATWLSLDEAQEVLERLISAAGFLLDGHIPPTLLSLGETTSLFKDVTHFASARGYYLPFTSVYSLLTLPATTRRNKRSDWDTLLHVPFAKHEPTCTAYMFPNTPFPGPGGEPWTFEIPRGLIGVTQSLPDETRAIFVPEPEIHNKCLRFHSTYVCPDIAIIKRARKACPSGLLFGHIACKVTPAQRPLLPIVHGSTIFAFTPNTTLLAINCPGKQPFNKAVSGQVIIRLDPECQASTDLWTHTAPKTFGPGAVKLVLLSDTLHFLGTNSTPTRHDLSTMRRNLSTLASEISTINADHSSWSTPDVIIISVTTIIFAALGAGVSFVAFRIWQAGRHVLLPRSLNLHAAEPLPNNNGDVDGSG